MVKFNVIAVVVIAVLIISTFDYRDKLKIEKINLRENYLISMTWKIMFKDLSHYHSLLNALLRC